MKTLFILLLLFQTPRNSTEVRKFEKLTGGKGKHIGQVVDHKIPLCAGGPNSIDNMRWETLLESYKKDSFERALCREMKRQGYTLIKTPELVK